MYRCTAIWRKMTFHKYKEEFLWWKARLWFRQITYPFFSWNVCTSFLRRFIPEGVSTNSKSAIIWLFEMVYNLEFMAWDWDDSSTSTLFTRYYKLGTYIIVIYAKLLLKRYVSLQFLSNYLWKAYLKPSIYLISLILMKT